MTDDDNFFALEESPVDGGVPEGLRGWLDLLRAEPEPVKLGNKNKSGECGMCGARVGKLYPRKVGQVDFMICGNCMSIMSMGRG